MSAPVTATGVVQCLTVADALRVKLVKREGSPNSSIHSDMDCIEDDNCKTPDIEMTDVSTNVSSDNEMNRICDASSYTDIKQAYSPIEIVSDTSVNSNISSNVSNLSLEMPIRPSSTPKKNP